MSLKISSAIEKEVDSLVRIGYYETKEGVIVDAVRALLEKKPELRREIAIHLYKNGEVSLWKASEIARMNLEEFKEVLSHRGIKIKVSVTKEESDKRLKEVFDA
ncbi:MAG TPA: hypothetical protein C5S37_01280 [Methanophagales archaeon]|nr:hypothetical protein [Methanophagales archaeon]